MAAFGTDGGTQVDTDPLDWRTDVTAAARRIEDAFVIGFDSSLQAEYERFIESLRQLNKQAEAFWHEVARNPLAVRKQRKPQTDQKLNQGGIFYPEDFYFFTPNRSPNFVELTSPTPIVGESIRLSRHATIRAPP